MSTSKQIHGNIFEKMSIIIQYKNEIKKIAYWIKKISAYT